MDVYAQIRRDIERVRASVARLLTDEQGVAVVEYSLVLSVFSIASGMAFVQLQSVAQGTIGATVTGMQSYAVDPTSFECAAGVAASCS